MTQAIRRAGNVFVHHLDEPLRGGRSDSSRGFDLPTPRARRTSHRKKPPAEPQPLGWAAGGATPRLHKSVAHSTFVLQ